MIGRKWFPKCANFLMDTYITTCRLQDLSADIDMIPDTQCSDRPHTPTSTQLPSHKYPHRSEPPSCEEELLSELPLRNRDAQDWKEINGGLPLSVACGDDEHKMNWHV